METEGEDFVSSKWMIRNIYVHGIGWGAVEIFYKGTWGTIGDDFWDINDTEVVCNQQVCGHAVSSSGDVTFSHSPRNIVMDDVQRRGNGTYLWECSPKGCIERSVAVAAMPVSFCSCTRQYPCFIKKSHN